MNFTWHDYNPDTMKYVENWLDEYAVRMTGMDEGFRQEYEYWSNEDCKSICEKAICEGVCYECKCADLIVRNEISGPICFYINGDDTTAHKKVIKFMLDNNLIRKTKSGRLYDESFKLDS